MAHDREPLSAEQVQEFHRTLSNWGRFGERDQYGTLNLITPSRRKTGAGLVSNGTPVSCARSLPAQPAADTSFPVQHMIGTATEGRGGDYLAIAPLVLFRGTASPVNPIAVVLICSGTNSSTNAQTCGSEHALRAIACTSDAPCARESAVGAAWTTGADPPSLEAIRRSVLTLLIEWDRWSLQVLGSRFWACSRSSVWS
jgi:hypothetical protein